MAAKKKAKKQERTIADSFSLFKDVCEISDKEIAKRIFENHEIVSAIGKTSNSEICTSLLFKLYYVATEEWVGQIERKKTVKLKIEKVQATRNLRNLCKEEIGKRAE